MLSLNSLYWTWIRTINNKTIGSNLYLSLCSSIQSLHQPNKLCNASLDNKIMNPKRHAENLSLWPAVFCNFEDTQRTILQSTWENTMPYKLLPEFRQVHDLYHISHTDSRRLCVQVSKGLTISILYWALHACCKKCAAESCHAMCRRKGLHMHQQRSSLWGTMASIGLWERTESQAIKASLFADTCLSVLIIAQPHGLLKVRYLYILYIVACSCICNSFFALLF